MLTLDGESRLSVRREDGGDDTDRSGPRDSFTRDVKQGYPPAGASSGLGPSTP